MLDFVGFQPKKARGLSVTGDGEGEGVQNGDSTCVMTKEHAAAFKKVLL